METVESLLCHGVLPGYAVISRRVRWGKSLSALTFRTKYSHGNGASNTGKREHATNTSTGSQLTFTLVLKYNTDVAYI